MVASLPTPGGDTGTWAGELNDYLLTEHNSDGSHKNKQFDICSYGAGPGKLAADNTDAIIRAARDLVEAGGGRLFASLPGEYDVAPLADIATAFIKGVSNVYLDFAGVVFNDTNTYVAPTVTNNGPVAYLFWLESVAGIRGAVDYQVVTPPFGNYGPFGPVAVYLGGDCSHFDLLVRQHGSGSVMCSGQAPLMLSAQKRRNDCTFTDSTHVAIGSGDLGPLFSAGMNTIQGVVFGAGPGGVNDPLPVTFTYQDTQHAAITPAATTIAGTHRIAWYDMAEAPNRHGRFLTSGINTGYGFACAYSAVDVEGHIWAEGCDRASYVYGYEDLRLHVQNKNQQGNTIIGNFIGYGGKGLELWFTDLHSTTRNVTYPGNKLIILNFPDTTPARTERLKLHLAVDNSVGSNPYGLIFSIDKGVSPSYDEVARGHVIDGIDIDGWIKMPGGGGAGSAFASYSGKFVLPAVGASSNTRDIIRRLRVHDLELLQADPSTVGGFAMWLEAIEDLPVFENIHAPSVDFLISMGWGGNAASIYSMTQGSATLTTSGSFNRHEVGMTVIIAGAGANHGALEAQVIDYVNATTVTLSRPAAFSVGPTASGFFRIGPCIVRSVDCEDFIGMAATDQFLFSGCDIGNGASTSSTNSHFRDTWKGGVLTNS